MRSDSHLIVREADRTANDLTWPHPSVWFPRRSLLDRLIDLWHDRRIIRLARRQT